MKNYFSSGDDTLTDETTVFISQAAYMAFKDHKSNSLDMGDGPEGFSYDPETDALSYPVAVDDQYGDIGAINAFKVKNEETGHSLIIHDNSQAPLIIAMDLGWTIRLVAIL